MPSIGHKIEGLDELLRKLNPEQLMGKPLKDFWHRAAFAVEKYARMRAPFRTGRTQDSLVSRIDPSPMPMWGEVGTGVTAKGVSYPTVLEMSNKTHYRATSRMGQPTKGWFSGALPDAERDIARAKDELGNDIERNWKA